MNTTRLFISLLVLCLLSFISNTNAQTNEDSTLVAQIRPYSYAIGMTASGRYAPMDLSLGSLQNRWSLYGGGISVLRYRNYRTFWSTGIGYFGESINLRRGIDIRYFPNSPGPNGSVTTEVGTKTERWNYRYLSVPVGFNHLMFATQGTNLYVSGEVIFDWLYRYKREINATYDGRTDHIIGGRLDDVSATLGVGAGVYQPVGPLVLMLGVHRGHTFYSDFDRALSQRQRNTISAINLRVLYRIRTRQ